AFSSSVTHGREALRRAEGLGAPVVFNGMHAMYAMVSPDSAAHPSVRFLELSDALLDTLFPKDSRFYQMNKGFRVERDVVRVHARRFGFPRLVSREVLDTFPAFVVYAYGANIPRGYGGLDSLARRIFPRHRVAAASGELLLLERISER
ncbi:MAG TPA: hypothetical protein VML75_28575, partial [Kofleriaceae bacterium]|nr:hypothetical protein [Kofleriaceae bacterium]